MAELLSVTHARQQLLNALIPVDSLKVSIEDAANRVLAQDVIASRAAPSFANSSMDGFAVRAVDVPDAPVRLKVVGDIPAGTFIEQSLKAGEAMRIMTGAPMPDGADAVVPVEHTNIARNEVDLPSGIEVRSTVEVGQYVRHRGEDFSVGDVLMEAGTRLQPQGVGLLAMLGMSDVEVYRRPRVAVLSTGDELIPVGEELGQGQIHNSNSYSLAALVQSCFVEVVDVGIAADTEQAVKAKLDEAVKQQVDVIISSAGVSVGTFDYVRNVVEQHGELGFWRVNMRPGKPLTFGHFKKAPFIGLPGNPVSSFVGFEVFVRPALHKLAGVEDWKRFSTYAILEEDVESDGRESYMRAVFEKRNGNLIAALTGHQGSGNLYSLVQANGLIILPAHVKSLTKGSRVEAWLFG
ncbi:MAG: molybdopterin molybdenumtransferase MoeA [Chloroflexi bacterium]|nr:MAG: molybdopterin molybdenumtransferase MoeA [Chloroflexota bacterium]MBL1193719.1 molybdopterin molybdenumtransferase MoeA [Chloroflexota bacterium]NOH11012.1 molybdopterin molybdotransferase MoeA [Chloroflexota bacterium]